jgi:arylformamidase
MTLVSGYDLDPTTPAAQALQAEYARLSARAATLEGARLDLGYGDHDRQRLDVFSAGPEAPAIIFFHGGYWRAGSKDARRFPAAPWHARGVSWVCVNYRLTPDFSLYYCVEDVLAATRWLHDNAAALALNPAQMHLSGISAGAHLAAMAAQPGPGRPRFRSLSLISGLFDLTPLIGTSSNDWLRLDAKDASALSSVNHLPSPDLPIVIGYGGAETPAFKDQSALFADACRAGGNPVEMFESTDADHFGIIGEYGNPEALLFQKLAALLAQTE